MQLARTNTVMASKFLNHILLIANIFSQWTARTHTDTHITIYVHVHGILISKISSNVWCLVGSVGERGQIKLTTKCIFNSICKYPMISTDGTAME